MRLATFNVENMFDRAAILNRPGTTWADNKKVLQDFAELTDLTEKDLYSSADKARMLELMDRNAGLLTVGKSRYILLNKIRGSFTRKPKNKPVEIVADGRSDWIGWFELRKEHVEEIAIENTARIINEVNADVLCVVEADNRIVLTRFNDQVIPKVGGQKYDHAMLIDGNDERGIDVGILTRKAFPIESMVSHVYDDDGQGAVFSRDCAEYRVATPSGKTLLILVNHFKSKGYGTPASSNEKRERQARQVRKIYDDRLQAGFEYIAIAGDLNDTPASGPLAPLTGDDALMDMMSHPNFVGDGKHGTYKTGGAKNSKIDYILMSPKLVQAVQSGGINRRGVWHGKKSDRLPELEEEKDAASDHAALWVDLDL